MLGVLVKDQQILLMLLGEDIIMEVININKNNIDLIVEKQVGDGIRDYKFLNSLWQYVLYSKSVSRRLPVCEMCGIQGDFKFEGYNGIKKVGGGMMYIPIGENKIYAISDMMFHYFFIHNMVPTKEFRRAVIEEIKPPQSEYANLVKELYIAKMEPLNTKMKCKYCGRPYIGTTVYRKGSKKKEVVIYDERRRSKLFNKEKYLKMCYYCFGVTKS